MKDRSETSFNTRGKWTVTTESLIDYADGSLSRSDMIDLLRNTEDTGVISAAEVTDLQNIVNSTLVVMSDYVRVLGQHALDGQVANVTSGIGNLAAGDSGTKMENLVGKWFLGTDRPVASGVYTYAPGQLFVNDATMEDIQQGSLGDCYYVASLAEVAYRDPQIIHNMFIDNGDNTFTVAFYNGGKADYVTVDRYLPADSSGNPIYAKMGGPVASAGSELWAAEAEKAYAEMNELGWLAGPSLGQHTNSYASLSNGYADYALSEITGHSSSWQYMTSTSEATFQSELSAGKLIVLCSESSGSGNGVVDGHAYAARSYDSTTGLYTLYNPWGSYISLTWTQIQQSYSWQGNAAGVAGALASIRSGRAGGESTPTDVLGSSDWQVALTDRVYAEWGRV